jgi:Na+-transporting NADH:ubiquinone oxidoreductase subunit C
VSGSPHSRTYTLVFVGVISVACAALLAASASLLGRRIADNQALDVNKNILECLGVLGQDGLPAKGQLTAADVNGFFQQRLEALAVDHEGRPVKTEVAIAKLLPWKEVADLGPERARLPLYILKDPRTGQPLAYCFPVWGKGLWGALYGYLALERDGATVRGITFYSHQETPGLGARIEDADFRQQFAGKKVRAADGTLKPVAVLKGRVQDKVSAAEAPYYVDGISGATLTGKGVTALLHDCLELYEPYFRQVRAGTAQAQEPSHGH